MRSGVMTPMLRGAAILAVVATLVTGGALAAANQALGTRAQASPQLLVIQGVVKAIKGHTVAVRTPDQRPVCVPGQMCAMCAKAGMWVAAFVSCGPAEIQFTLIPDGPRSRAT